MNEYYLCLTNQMITNDLQMSDISLVEICKKLEPKSFSFSQTWVLQKCWRGWEMGQTKNNATFLLLEPQKRSVFTCSPHGWLSAILEYLKEIFLFLDQHFFSGVTTEKLLACRHNTQSLCTDWCNKLWFQGCLRSASSDRVSAKTCNIKKKVDVKQDTQGELNLLSWMFSVETRFPQKCYICQAEISLQPRLNCQL